MELEALITQIGELEQVNRKEQQKLLEETLRHKNTATELEKANATIEQLKAKLVRIEDKVHSDEVQITTDCKTIEDLKATVKNYQQEIGLLQERLEKEKRLGQEKTDEFLVTIDNFNVELRKIHAYYQEKSLAKELEATKSELQEAEERVAKDNPQEIESLKGQLVKALDAQEQAESALRAAPQPMVVEQANEEKLLALQALKAEMEMSKKKNEELEAAMQKMTADFQKDANLVLEEKEQLEATLLTYEANAKDMVKMVEALCPSCKAQAKAILPAPETTEAV